MTPTPPASKEICVGDNFRRWEFQAKAYVSLSTQAEGARVPAALLDGEALGIAVDENILQGDITEGTLPPVLWTNSTSRGETRSFYPKARRLYVKGFTDDTPEVREQRILQQALEGTRDPSTRRAFRTAAPTSIQKALDGVGTTEQVNGVIERDQQYRTREIALVLYRPLARLQPFNRQGRYGPQRMQQPPYQKPH
ncbi:hypothetical protein EG68_10624 [Paragonimus skrjabini miyazakii]|uniref:Uncharacterized protein n=1 Tax=Paragonimus skrjabini miyazakii TaxID=59628 RepID=A0A8S9YJM4_9TREM|nr:hypothetical protein EG68_10624 [Paragonimus skrjabini miyazakii]